mgnify:CR=1 FL=1
MKKKVILGVLFLSVCSVLTACGGKNASYKDGTYEGKSSVYENEDGVQLVVVNLAQVRTDSTFQAPSAMAPFGYAFQTAHFVAVGSDEAVEGDWADFALSDAVIRVPGDEEEVPEEEKEAIRKAFIECEPGDVSTDSHKMSQ